MGKTSIEWTDESSNPIRARRIADDKAGWHCVKISPGCANCYSERRNKWVGTGLGFTRHATAEVESVLIEKELCRLIKMKEPRRVFLGDMTDVFGDWVPDEWLDRIFAVMALTPHITYQVLTKRAERLPEYFRAGRNGAWGQPAYELAKEMGWATAPRDEHWLPFRERIVNPPLPNLWLGVSCENQATADERIPHLLATPVAVRFLSMEPLLGPVSLTPWFDPTGACCGGEPEYECPRCPASAPWRYSGPADESSLNEPRIDWVIVGGESGPGARPMHPLWACSLRDQCQAAGVAFFFKQWGEWCPEGQHMPYLRDVIGGRGAHVSRALFPDGKHLPDLTGRGSNGDGAIRIFRLGKKASGRLLDGREWNEFPATLEAAHA